MREIVPHVENFHKGAKYRIVEADGNIVEGYYDTVLCQRRAPRRAKKRKGRKRNRYLRISGPLLIVITEHASGGGKILLAEAPGRFRAAFVLQEAIGATEIAE